MGRIVLPSWFVAFTVVDLFSGAGGMSYGFHAHRDFEVVAAVDAQVGKPSTGAGKLECNESYRANIGLTPLAHDLARVAPSTLRRDVGGEPTVLISCAPCTGFSRALANNHLVDDPRHSLVARSAEFVAALRPTIFLMENARELLRGNFTHHFDRLRSELERLGYQVHAATHLLNRFGLPQVRERALVIATRGVRLRTLEELWSNAEVVDEATHVRRAIEHLPRVDAGVAHPADPNHVSPSFADPTTRKRLSLIPRDGGSWADLRSVRGGPAVLTDAMRRSIARGDLGSFPDVYGRLSWDKPAVTIKRECAHVGNGRYSHPEQDRLCTVRELGLLNGFPEKFRFVARSIANMYRHIGDAVPPLVSHQLAHLCGWMLTGKRPAMADVILPGTSLRATDFTRALRPGRVGVRSAACRIGPMA